MRKQQRRAKVKERFMIRLPISWNFLKLPEKGFCRTDKILSGIV
jgi:hypothetical protein